MIGVGWPGSEIYINPHAVNKDNKMTQALECQRCGEFIDTVLSDRLIIIYHKQCWVDFQQELIALARGKTWRKLGQSTEYSEDLNRTEGKYNNYD